MNPVLRSGVMKSPLEGFELTDEVEWGYIPRIITSGGARLLAVAIDLTNSVRGHLVASIVTKETL